jgi:hypothetical protein
MEKRTGRFACHSGIPICRGSHDALEQAKHTPDFWALVERGD